MGDAENVLAQLARMGIEVKRLVADSRQVKRGDVFLAYPGVQTDGRRFIAQAAAAGAAAVLWESEGFSWDPSQTLPNLPVPGLREAAGHLAHLLYGRPSEKLWVIAVTGTNGKTSCSHWIAQALGEMGRQCAVLGTLGMGLPGELVAHPNTTPDALLLHAHLAAFAARGIAAVALEASSIGIHQGRMNGVKVDVALFTNLSRDHLDYHADMESYAQAKMMLFRTSGLKHAVLNLDDALGVRLAQMLADSGIERIGYSLAAGAAERGGVEHWLEARSLEQNAQGIAFTLASSWGEAELQTRLVGRFNAANVLGVIGALAASGATLEAAVSSAALFEPVAGRMQRVGGENQPLVIVDYAHTPDALDKVLGALRDVAQARGGHLICMFGCGGERDRGKRPLMGEAASRFADWVIVTSDNPRSEDPLAIIADILPGLSGPFEVHVDRRAAIRRAIELATPHDVVLLAGKGHETYQEIEGRRIPMSDLAVAAEALRR